jgi:mannose-1-phosphate guanylyltransferase / mannose-6-phosphate isomerase
VILCGGSGERLWPASRPWRPKPFLRLVGDRSSFQETALRAQGLGPLVVLGGAAHAGLIAEQLAEMGVEAVVLLEPVARDTAAAIAVAAAWVAGREPDAIVAVLASDHHIPDAPAFRAAIAETLAAAAGGAIVTLGLKPTSASEALGYIRPGEGADPVKPIAAFDEKPDAVAAAALVEAGALWNSGTFVARAATLLAETQQWAPDVATAAQAALSAATTEAGVVQLGADFARAPSIAFDRAVMERTDRGAVLPADFAWSDLGAWDAVLAAADPDADGNVVQGAASTPGSRQVLVRAAPGMRVSVVGAMRLAVVVEADAVLVCDLGHAQAVRDVSGQGGGRFASLAEAARWFDSWLRTAALPLWGAVGVDPETGGFREALTWEGRPFDPRRRTRVQARQAFVFARAATDGLPGPWRAVAERGFDWFAQHARRSDGLFATTLDVRGAQTSSEPHLYEHAFVLLALAALERADEAEAVLAALDAFRHPQGGFREAGEHPFQANAHMHLLEAAIAWEQAGGGPVWRALADELTDLAVTRLIDPVTGTLHEFFDADWRPLAGDAGLIEPGHQFEWAWLLAQRPGARGVAAARGLFEAGRRGFDPGLGMIVNALHDDLSVRDPAARLWPQTEHLKAALALDDEAAALEAAGAMAAFLDTPVRGVWRERRAAHGGFIAQPSPATSLYHLYLAIRELARFAGEPC